MKTELLDLEVRLNRRIKALDQAKQASAALGWLGTYGKNAVAEGFAVRISGNLASACTGYNEAMALLSEIVASKIDEIVEQSKRAAQNRIAAAFYAENASFCEPAETIEETPDAP